MIVLLADRASADELYKVTVLDQEQAEYLAGLDLDPVLRLNDGYLLLADPAGAQRLAESPLNWEFIAGGVTRQELVLDGRRDLANAKLHEPLFEQDEIKLYVVEDADPAVLQQRQLFPLGSK